MATPRIVKRIRRAFLKYQEAHGGRRIFEKTPSNVLRVPFVREVFPEARFLHIYRDGYDSVSSAWGYWTKPISAPTRIVWARMRQTPIREWPLYLPRFLRNYLAVRLGTTKLRKHWGLVYPGIDEDLANMHLIQVVAKQWVAGVETSLADLAGLDRELWIEIRYEDCVRDPLATFRRILDFFDLEMSDALSQYLRTEIHPHSIGIHKNRLTPEQIARIDPIIRPVMERLGYEASEIAW